VQPGRPAMFKGKTMSLVRSISAILIAALLLSGCAQPKTICGTTYEPYGLLNADEKKNPDIEYEIVLGNVFWGVVLFETAIAPLYLFGFSIFQPIGPRSQIKGAVHSECSKEKS
jgi:hypothetical protein